MPIADTVIRLQSPQTVMAALLDHLGEHGSVTGSEAAWSVAFEIGTASARLLDGSIAFRVEAPDDTSLSFLQWGVVEHVHEFAPAERPEVSWRGGLAAGTRPPYFREMQVVSARNITPRMRRLTLAGDNLERFAQHGIHIRLLLRPRHDAPVVWPVMAADGRQAWPEGERPVMRIYTIRSIDVAAGTMDVDFVLHEGDDMPGARFGAEAKPGDLVGMTGPGGGTLKVAPSYLFLGDETALPAIGRLLEELPDDAKAKAYVEIADDAERQDIAVKPGVDLVWLSRGGKPAGSTDGLLQALRDVPGAFWGDDPYVWAGCEQSTARAIKAHLADTVRLKKGRSVVGSYWKLGAAGEVDE
ncbi:siderophore-interacting protein [Mesorhizobium sp. J428]|uniref:siderophore-interacting protein n=1 Tax=Mesorhizobium sp. J428 TaxID=2898440 RepID=UPI002151F614|nr:siderophore-interacting protein [Mesorhizobium sp. J428]MCR5856527.1 siderophore-interacting protein [Mesorhizobium sp. J428]